MELTFPFELGIIRSIIHANLKTEVLVLKKYNTLSLLVAVVSATVVVTASVIAAVLFFEKKKRDEEELEHYLDCSIQ